jgi:hypothetical protein
MAAVTTIVRSLTRQLSWTHYYYLIDINENEKRTFYENKVIINSWSVREYSTKIPLKRKSRPYSIPSCRL